MNDGMKERRNEGEIGDMNNCRDRRPLSRARLLTSVQDDGIHIFVCKLMLLEAPRSVAERGFQKRRAAMAGAKFSYLAGVRSLDQSRQFCNFGSIVPLLFRT